MTVMQPVQNVQKINSGCKLSSFSVWALLQRNAAPKKQWRQDTPKIGPLRDSKAPDTYYSNLIY